MNNEEAIKQLESVTIYHQGKCTREALDMAIEALEKQIPEDIVVYNREWLCPCCGESLDFNNKKVSRCKCGKVLRWDCENN